MTKKYEFDWQIPVPQPLLDGSLCDRWIESKNETTFELNCMFKVDETGFFLYWKSDGHEGDVIDLCQVSDVRTGGVPIDSRLLNKLSSIHGDDLDSKSLTVCTNENYIDIEYTHLVFSDAATAKVWQDGLRKITHNSKSSNVSARMSLKKHWIRLGFCVDVNGKVPVKVILKTFASGKTDKLVYQALKELGLPDGKNDSIDKEQFTFDQFWELYKKICPRNDIEELFRTITKGQGDGIKMTAFINFMNDFQRDPNMNEMLYPKFDIKRCTEIINDYEMDEKKKSLKQLSIEGFTRYLMSDENAPVFLDTLGIHQDMDQPLAHYYINSSHNTYLSGRQFGGKSTVEMYRQTLLAGCRCVELDCWDGKEPESEPIITHGHAMCTEISYKDVIFAIRDCAFVSSEYPVILSFENHCCRDQQYKMAKYCDEIFGELLCKEPLPDYPLDPGRPLPPPSLLKNKILIKNKRMKPEVEKAEMELFLKGELKTDDDAKEDATETAALPVTTADPATPVEGGGIQNAEAAAIATHTGSTTNVHPWLSSLVNYAEPIHFNGFDNAEKKNISHNMSSFAESKGLDYLKTNAIDFVNYNKRQMSRIYPKGTRADSSNYMPQLFWNAGCQMVSLNFQTSDLPMQLNQGKFEYNGGCGYLLKPDFMRRADVDFDPFSDTPIDGVIAQCVKVSVIAGSFLSEKKVGTYVEVDMFGLPSDTIKKEFRTRTIPANGLNPQYNEDPFVFRKVVLPYLAVLRFAVYDENDKCLGQRILPMDSIQVGYRHISLRTEANFPMSLPCLFVHIDVSIYIPDGFGDFMTALSDPGAFAKSANAQKDKMAALGIEATNSGAAANAIKGQKEAEPPLVFEPVTVDLLKQEKGFQKFEKKNKKELASIRKKSNKERVTMQKKDYANIEKLMVGKSGSEIKSNAELKKLIQEQNNVWAEMIARHRKSEFDILKKHLVEQEEQLKVQMQVTQAAQMKQLEDKHVKDMKEKDLANVKANVELSKEVNLDVSVKTKGDKDRRLRELKGNALKRFLEEKKTLGIKHARTKEKLAKAHEQQLAGFSGDLKRVVEAYTVEEEEYKECAKNEFFI